MYDHTATCSTCIHFSQSADGRIHSANIWLFCIMKCLQAATCKHCAWTSISKRHTARTTFTEWQENKSACVWMCTSEQSPLDTVIIKCTKSKNRNWMCLLWLLAFPEDFYLFIYLFKQKSLLLMQLFLRQHGLGNCTCLSIYEKLTSGVMKWLK